MEIEPFFVCRLKFWRQSCRQNNYSNGQSPLLRGLRESDKWSQKGRFEKIMESNLQKKRESSEDTELSNGVTEEKIKFPLYVYPDTMEKVDMLYKFDNCSSRTEFIEKAVRFYCGYLLNKESTATEFIAPQLASITEGIVKGSEQKLSRSLFKLAVEVGALTHMVAAINEIDDDTLHKLRIMCVDEVKRINGIINFEKAVRYQMSDE